MDLSCLMPVFQRFRVSPELASAIRDALLSQNAAQIATLDALITAPDVEPAVSVPSPDSPVQRDRYEDLGPLGSGGMGEVRQVRDLLLNRTLAMKTLHARHLTNPHVVKRFLDEARVCATLQHPHIIAVHDVGHHHDGRPYFTMQEIRGQDLSRAIHKTFEDVPPGARPEPRQLRHLIETFLRMCEAVAYAHTMGVLHRDLKPANVMLGAVGEVIVVDWGIAKIVGRTDSSHVSETTTPARDTPLVGQVTGTPAYMAPEQANGCVDQIDHRVDVYALGATLYEILTGQPPYRGSSTEKVLEQVRAGPPRALHTRSHDTPESSLRPPTMPLALIDICERAMARDPQDRIASVSNLADEIRSWLEGTRKGKEARQLVARAAKIGEEARTLQFEAQQLQAQGEALLHDLPLWASDQVKSTAWNLEDRARALEQRIELLQITRDQMLDAALILRSDLPEAHAALAWIHREAHRRAETEGDTRARRRARLRLQRHTLALPKHHVDRAEHLSYQRGTGRISLATSVPGATVLVERFVEQHRRLVPQHVGVLGTTPLTSVPLEMGSYRLRIRKEGFHEVLYPVHLERRAHWDGIPPGQDTTHSIWLPPLGSLAEDSCYIPAGWFWSGGDSLAYTGLPRRRLWAPGFVMKRFPVTNRKYIAFLDALVDAGREEEALAYAPRERPGHAKRPGHMIYGRDDNGRFILVPDSDGDLWEPTWPVMMVDWHGAVAYARWRQEVTGHAWRLPSELEWAKAARGVDARTYPWGNHLDASWCCYHDSHPGHRLPVPVDSFPVDESVYEVRGLGGGTRDWCAEVFTTEGPPTDGETLLPPGDPDTILKNESRLRATRGGSWFNNAQLIRATNRVGLPVYNRNSNLGFRLVRPLKPTA